MACKPPQDQQDVRKVVVVRYMQRFQWACLWAGLKQKQPSKGFKSRIYTHAPLDIGVPEQLVGRLEGLLKGNQHQNHSSGNPTVLWREPTNLGGSKKTVPKWNPPDKWKHGPKPAEHLLLNFEPHPCQPTSLLASTPPCPPLPRQTSGRCLCLCSSGSPTPGRSHEGHGAQLKMLKNSEGEIPTPQTTSQENLHHAGTIQGTKGSTRQIGPSEPQARKQSGTACLLDPSKNKLCRLHRPRT